MSDFAKLTEQVSTARTAREAAQTALDLARQARKALTEQLTRAGRIGDRAALERLQAEARGLEGKLAERTQALEGAKATLAGAAAALAQLAEPPALLGEWSDSTPILLFPVRIETRFRGRELWIRLYPDDCQLDGFEPTLRDAELKNVSAFWIAFWRAGGIEAQQRGAWSALVGSLGSGRAGYAIAQFAPLNPGDRPNKAAAEDVVLVITPSIALTSAEQALMEAYWLAVWAADGDLRLTAPAYATLESNLGAARAAELVQGFAPDPNGWDPPSPKTRAEVIASCVVLRLPAAPATTSSWNSPRIALQPDRFAAILYSGANPPRTVFGAPVRDGLAVAPDPSATGAAQISASDGDLTLPDELRWIAEFPQALAVGMGIVVPLSAAEASTGFDRLLVVGLRSSSSAERSKQELELLIEHQLASSAGFGIVPQGSPTNNTDSGGTPHSWVEDPNASYDIVFNGASAYSETSDPLLRRDGEWLAQALGVDGRVIQRLAHANGVDQAEARAMNIALWNGTLGYGLEEMLSPVLSRTDIALTRTFFTRYVSGRGPLPAVRVGNQPYGVLTAMAFSRYQARANRKTGVFGGSDYLQRLHHVLSRMDADFRTLASGVAHVGKVGDAHQLLLDIVGLHSGSVEYHQRYAESFDQIWNQLVLEGGWLVGGLLAAWLATRGKEVLQTLGADPNANAAILSKFFYGNSPRLSGPVVDDAPLSEDKPVRAYSNDGRNYLTWLATASLEQIRTLDFGGKPAPSALLFLMLRHSMMLGQWDAGLRLLERHALIEPGALRSEPAFLHVQSVASDKNESKFARLIVPQPAITGSATQSLADYALTPAVLFADPALEDVAEMVHALERLSGVPTARLERIFAEHVDCVSYRLDAWKTGLAAERLAELRGGESNGIYLGAFGWLEDLRPRAQANAPVRLEGELEKVFQRQQDPPLERDPANAGYIHAPSLNQAAAAAILKNAYCVNASPANPDAMAVNLSSRRVRQAMTILEGMRNGQTLGALLGYRFERGLHDEHALAEVDKFIYPLRQTFPLVANQLKNTRTDGTVEIQLIEARNVLDGQKLVDHVKQSQQASYPFGLTQLPPATPTERTAIDTEVDRLLDLADALADLTLAESVYQVVLGNFDRAAAVTTALQSGAPPPAMQIVDTPRTGLSLQQRVVLHLDPTVSAAVSPTTVMMTPRALAEAPLNDWLARHLPDPNTVCVQVSYSSPASGPTSLTVTQAELGLQAIDLLYFGDLELEQAMAEMDDRILQFVRYGAGEHPALALTIQYTEPTAGVSLFQLAALVRSLRQLILHSRTLAPTDLAMPHEASGDQSSLLDADELQTRLATALSGLTVRRDALTALAGAATDLDAYARDVSAELLETARYGMPDTGSGQIHGDLRAIYEALSGKIASIVQAWQDRSAEYVTRSAGYAALPNEQERIALVRSCELLVSASLSVSPPAAADDYKALTDAAHDSLDADIVALSALLAWNGTRLADYLSAVTAVVPIVARHDLIALDVSAQVQAMVTLRSTIASRVAALAADVTQRVADANAALVALAAIEAPADRVAALLAAAKRVLGEEILLVPHFYIGSEQGAELVQALAGSAGLLTDLLAAGRYFPVDDWLYGVARVRPKLAAWENTITLGEAFGVAGGNTLTPLQLPFVVNDRWAALEFDGSAAAPGDRLLYTAHFSAPFVATAPQCGLVLDDWPEVVPTTDVSSGVTFQYDRPNSAPPQTLLLAVPATITGNWTWDELLATLNETLDAAKSRAVEPAQIDGSNYAQLLPSTVMAVTLRWLNITTNLALNNHIYTNIEQA